MNPHAVLRPLLCILYIGIALFLPLALAAQADESPEIIWECITEITYPDGEEVERCGYGYYRQLCGTSEGVEECVADFVFEETGASNVLFLPGIKGSRLYDEEGEKLWEPFGNGDVEALMLDEDGKSMRDDIRTEPGDIVDRVAGLIDIYGSFADFMDELVEDGVMNAWEPFAYDWRLSLPDIVSAGFEYERPIPTATRVEYLLSSVTYLAQTSKTGKVTIIAHSNGGLVAKELMRSLGPRESAKYIDDVIFVGVPQSGAPQALAALLYGYEEGTPTFLPSIVSTHTARAFAENAPMGYHLLPSEGYFDTAGREHPVVAFGDGRAYEIERGAYGGSVDSFEELASFARAEEGGRERPLPIRIDQANVLNASLLEYAKRTHDTLDAWMPPPEIRVHQVAGSGASTVSGISYYEKCTLLVCASLYAPAFIDDGDGVVPASSALMLEESENVERYWIDLPAYGDGPIGKKGHGNLLAIEEVRAFIKNILEREPSPLPENIRDHEISTGAHEKKLLFLLHSPLTLEVTDADGNRTGPDGEAIPGSEYGVFGDVQFVRVPAGEPYMLELDGYASGTFALELRETQADDVTSEIAFIDVPTTEATLARMTVGPDLSTQHALEIDSNGDGSIDTTLRASAGETVGYAMPADPAMDAPVPRSSGSKRKPPPSRDALRSLRAEVDRLLIRALLPVLSSEERPRTEEERLDERTDFHRPGRAERDG